MNDKKTIRLATRKSRLALWQANHVKNALEKKHPHIQVILTGITTPGDQQKDKALAKIGGKSLFVKNLQLALLNNEADIAVHCVKDMSVHPTDGLVISAFLEREDPRDVFLSNEAESINQLKQNPCIGTASPRRASLLKSLRPDCDIKLLRGNVDSRIAKLKAGEYDAIVLAAAGLKRLHLENQIQSFFPPETFIPAIGQGALAIECRTDDVDTQALVSFLNHAPTAFCMTAEKAVNQKLDGDCYTPIGAHARIINSEIHLRALVGSLNGETILRCEITGAINDAQELGTRAAEDLLSQGAKKFI